MTLHLGNVRKAALAAALLLGPAAASAANPVGNAAAHDFSIHINLIGLTSLAVTSQTSASLLDVVTDASALDQLPPGNWIGGTIPYFMVAEAAWW